MKYIVFFITLLFLFLCSCNHKVNKNVKNGSVTYIHLDSLSESNIVLENINKCKFLKLETTNECLIKSIQKLVFDKGYIFILDVNQKIFTFNSEGKFLNTIGVIGNGPDEQLNFFDFYVDKKSKKVSVLDVYKSTIFEYSYNGELQDKLKFEKEVLKAPVSLALVDDNHILLSHDNDHTSLYSYSLINKKTKKQTGLFLPYIVTGNLTLAIPKCIAQSTKNIFISSFMSDTIYTYNKESESIVPSLIFKGNLEPLKKEDLKEQTFDLALDAYTIAKNKHFSTGIVEPYSTDKYLHFTFSENNNRYMVFWNLAEKKGYYYNYLFEGFTNFTSFSNLISTTDDAFVCAFDVDELEQDTEIPKTLRKLLEQSEYDDNPILVFYYFD